MEQEVKTKKIVVKKIKEVSHHSEWKGKGPKWSGSVLTEQDEWININCFKKEDVEQKLEGVEEGKEYLVYLEGKYENVKSFVPTDSFKDPELANKSDKELATQAPKESMKDIVQEGKGSVGGICPPPSSKDKYQEGQRVGMLFNNAVQLALFERNVEIDNIEKWFNSLRVLLNQLEVK